MLKTTLKTLITFLAFLPNICYSHSEASCLYSAVYYEANTEPLKGQIAVAEVIRNRAKKFKKSICSVVLQKKQFSWVGKKPMLKANWGFLNRLGNKKVLNNENVTFFFHKKLKPKWSKRMKCDIIGTHKFCWEGYKHEIQYRG